MIENKTRPEAFNVVQSTFMDQLSVLLFTVSQAECADLCLQIMSVAVTWTVCVVNSFIQVGSVATSEPIALHGRINDTWGLFRFLRSSEKNKSGLKCLTLALCSADGSSRLNTQRNLFSFLVANKQLESTTNQQLGKQWVSFGYAWKNNKKDCTNETPLANWHYFGSITDTHLRQSLHNDGFKHLL